MTCPKTWVCLKCGTPESNALTFFSNHNGCEDNWQLSMVHQRQGGFNQPVRICKDKSSTWKNLAAEAQRHGIAEPFEATTGAAVVPFGVVISASFIPNFASKSWKTQMVVSTHGGTPSYHHPISWDFPLWTIQCLGTPILGNPPNDVPFPQHFHMSRFRPTSLPQTHCWAPRRKVHLGRRWAATVASQWLTMSPRMGVSINGWFVGENPIVRNGWWLGVPLCQETFMYHWVPFTGHGSEPLTKLGAQQKPQRECLMKEGCCSLPSIKENHGCKPGRNMGVPQMEVPQNGWLIIEIPL